MLAGQREVSLGVIEVLSIDAGCLPVDGGVASGAVGSETSLMLVFMACLTTGCETKPGAAKILTGHERAHLRGNMLRRMAAATADDCMFPIERVAGL